VNKEIYEHQVKYQDFMGKLKSLQWLLTLKNQSLAEEELSLKWFTIQEGISAKKRKELSEGNEHLFLGKVPIQDLYFFCILLIFIDLKLPTFFHKQT